MHQHEKKNRVLYTLTIFSTHNTEKIHIYRLSFIMVKISIFVFNLGSRLGGMLLAAD